MNKKLILLMLILPLMLMFCIYTTSSTVGLEVKAPVTSISITGNDFVYLDFDSNEKYQVNYTIYPVTATNKEVLFTTERVGDQPFAQLEFVDGYIIAKSVGVAKVYLSTVDGGFKDSFIVQVDSLNVQKIECEVETTELMVGDSVSINTTFTPNNAINKMVSYSSSDTSVARVNNKGVIIAMGKGTATITVTSDANNNVYDTIKVTVLNQNIIDLVQKEFYTWDNSGSINISVDTLENYTLSYKVYDISNNLLTNAINEQSTSFDTTDKENVLLNYAFENDFYGSLVIEITITTENQTREPFSQRCTIHRVNELTASFDDDLVWSYTVDSTFALHNRITVNPLDADVKFETEVDNNNLEIIDSSTRVRLKAKMPGVTTVTLKVVSTTTPKQVVTLTKEIVVLPSNMQITETAQTYGIENLWTIGRYEANGSNNTSKVNLSLGKTTAGANFTNNFSFVTDNASVEVDNNGVIKITDDNVNDIVNIEGKFSYKNVELSTPKFKVRCVGVGVNIRNFEDLYNAVNNQKVVVLQNSIKEDFGKYKNGAQVYSENTVTKIETTYDATHYKNTNNLDQAKVKVLLNIKNDIYGNGYQINAHNVAYGLDSVGKLKQDALFKGPLNFVSMSETEASLVSVKAQDNISFAVYENVKLTNVTLSSCDLMANDSGNYDLRDLTYVGTTVEVLGDNVDISYCRLNNGRTVLRAFGDILDKTKAIHVNVTNSVLSSAREFVVRMGTNLFVDGTKENPSPYLDSNQISFPAQKTYNTMNSNQKQEYDNKYIKTFVTIKNSVLKDSGLFCVGIDAHFSGGALADGKGLAGGIVDSWKDLAKTSYGAKLIFEGDVRMYDWKLIDNVDSSTLIEILGASTFDLEFDIKTMITALATSTTNPQFNTIVHNQGSKQYVHGGIAFFGGGKNYGVFESKDYTFKMLNGYSVSFSDINKVELQVAAGQESFYFLVNDATTHGFLPNDQTNILNSQDAYAPIYK